MAHPTNAAHEAHGDDTDTDTEAGQKLTPAADTTMDVKTDAAPAPSVREHSPQSATDGPPMRAGDVARGNDLPHGMSADVPDDALGGTMAQGAATPGTASRALRDHEPNPDATDTASVDEGWQRIRNP